MTETTDEQLTSVIKKPEVQTEDPLTQITRVVRETAQTDNDRLLAEKTVERMDKLRGDWIDLIDKKRREAQVVGQPEPTLEEIFRTVRLEAPVVDYAQREIKFDKLGISRLGEYAVQFPIIHGYSTTPETWIIPGDAFRTRILKGLGVLTPQQELRQLDKLPGRWAVIEGGDSAPYEDRYGFKRLRSSIPGMQVEVGKMWEGINGYFSVVAFQKIVNFTATPKPPSA